MCEIFPEFDKCCICCSIRVGMLFISILSVMTGVLLLSTVVKLGDTNYDSLANLTKIDKDFKRHENDAKKIAREVLAKSPVLIPGILVAMSAIYVLAGLALLLGNLIDQEGLAQVFVWSTFLNVIIGTILVLVVGLECLFKSEYCMLKKLDFLSSAVGFIGVLAFLGIWLYFISVANSYVLNS